MRAHNEFRLPSARAPRPRWLALSVGAHVLALLVLLRMYSGFVFGTSESTHDVVAIAIPSGGAPRAHRAPPPPKAEPGTALVAPEPTPYAPRPTPPTVAPGGGGHDSGVTNGTPNGTGRLSLGAGRNGDPRLWVGPMYIPEGGGRPIDMDSIVRRRLLQMADLADSTRFDSLAPGGGLYNPPRWTFEHNGKTYGIDQNAIHFGSFSIPTALLALLPMPQGNIDQARANQRLADMRADLLRAAARAEAEEDFRRAVARIRERKDRERQEQRRRDEEQRRRDNDRPLP